MRIVIDIDGTICETKKPGQNYLDVRVNPGAAEQIKKLKDEGHYIILQTARHMKTTGGNIKLVIEKIGAITEQWLKDNGIVYDEIHFGKPYNHVIIDDRAFWFEGWDKFKSQDFDSNIVNIVINLVSDLGSFAEPQHFVNVLGKTVVEWVVGSFDELNEKAKIRLIFIVAEPDIKNFKADDRLKKMFGENIVIVPSSVSKISPLQAALLAKDYINNFQQLFVCDAKSFSLAPLWESMQEDNLVGMVVVSKDLGQTKQFVKKDDWGYVAEVVKDQTTTDMAATGTCYFTYGRDFISSAKNNEISVIPCYNDLVNRGQRVKAIKSLGTWDLSSPVALKAFEENFKPKQT